MTDNEIKLAIDYWEEFDSEIDDLIERHPRQKEDLLEQRRVVRITLDALKTLDNYEETSGAKKVRVDAIRKFAEKLKQRASLGEFPWDDLTVTTDQIDEFVKEMVGEDDEQAQTTRADT